MIQLLNVIDTARQVDHCRLLSLDQNGAALVLQVDGGAIIVILRELIVLPVQIVGLARGIV